MEQKTIIKTEEEKQLSGTARLRQEFQDQKATIVKEPETRLVTLKYKSCCGCGCDTIKVKRTVAFGSSLQTGDYITELQEGDKY